MKEKLHFWYSEKQRKVREGPSLYTTSPKHALIKRKKMEYTECSKKEELTSLWDDFVYLGKGVIYRIGDVLQ